MKTVSIYTDGSCLGNPGPGGWAALLDFQGRRKLLTGSDAETTNNRMELMAVIEGLGALKEACEVDVFTDSQYVMNAFAKGWLKNWKLNQWRTANREPVKNQDLWQTLDAVAGVQRIRWHWVKGHVGHPENELVNDAAMVAARNQTAPTSVIL